ncbi:hypothetical protein FSP39_009127 [Pinctada imbricata]|uniref:Uncharacterized protein n=1 Tax=Pinctada imbricata TaxID=66713 RepID=A0AA89C6Y2_PINIB|nr:hypothetical protein FSP39_009127 [Pinctada imbricata]
MTPLKYKLLRTLSVDQLFLLIRTTQSLKLSIDNPDFDKYKIEINPLELTLNKFKVANTETPITMKACVLLLVILPIVLSAPDKRWLVSLQQIEQEISHLITPDQTEAGCETGCKALISGLGEILCPTACHSRKRENDENLLAGLSLHSIEQQISHLITPEQTEAGCETGCKALISGLGTILCPSACSTYIDDVLSINNPKFADYLSSIYPSELEVKETTETNNSASYLDIMLSYDTDGHMNTSLYDKRDDFNFSITNFPFLSSNIPSSPAYGVFISQLIRYARASTKYTDFVLRARRLSDKLLSQGYVCDRLTSSLRKFYGRYGELVIHYDVPLSRMVDDILSYTI